jgi:hypothetical protein
MEMLYRHGHLSQVAIGMMVGRLNHKTMIRERAQDDKNLGTVLMAIEENLCFT